MLYVHVRNRFYLSVMSITKRYVRIHSYSSTCKIIGEKKLVWVTEMQLELLYGTQLDRK